MRPTIVLVHGAFAESASWDGVIEPLVAEGHRVIAAANPLRGLAADAASVSDLVRTIEGPVVLVAHSYGGAVISNVDRRRRRDRRARLRQRLRPGARRELLRARGHLPGQHARRGDGAAGPAQRRDDRPLHRRGELPRHVLPGRPRAAGRADGRHAAPRHPGGARRAVGRAPAVEGRARRGSSDRRGGPQHPRRAPALHGRARAARSGRSRSRARRTRSPSPTPTRRRTRSSRPPRCARPPEVVRMRADCGSARARAPRTDAPDPDAYPPSDPLALDPLSRRFGSTIDRRR